MIAVSGQIGYDLFGNRFVEINGFAFEIISGNQIGGRKRVVRKTLFDFVRSFTIGIDCQVFDGSVKPCGNIFNIASIVSDCIRRYGNKVRDTHFDGLF